jgi:beta-mannosidase
MVRKDLLRRLSKSFVTAALMAHSTLRAGTAADLETPPQSAQQVIDLQHGWGVMQDVHDFGEQLRIFRRDWNPTLVGPAISEWQPIDRLIHLQLLFAKQTYFGRELRYFNQAPWYYRLEFATPERAGEATLRFEGVDYYAKVWLNDQPLGEHEGYSDPFEFEVGSLLSTDKPNLLVVKVSSPWDQQIAPGQEGKRAFSAIRQMIKGTYEHADTFVQRDVNPVGIWRPVRLILHNGLHAAEAPAITSELLANATQAKVTIRWPIALNQGQRDAEFRVRIREDGGGSLVAQSTSKVTLQTGTTPLDAQVAINSPRLWHTWDRGGAALYRAELEIRERSQTTVSSQVTFGIRTVELRRSSEETRFYLNGQPIFLRGATYWPDLYVSASDRGRYERDVANAVRAGLNALRIHVHVENPELYEICDRLGVALIQDSDLNWMFPNDEAFTERAVKVFGQMVKKLRNHPSIIAWICINEASSSQGRTRQEIRPGPQLVAEAHRLDPSRPTIKNSRDRTDLESGDGHDYRGSLEGGHYTDIFGSKEKLSTEFGADAPPGAERLQRIPRLAERLKDLLPHLAEIHDYQYWLLKYYIEHYRIQKYEPCSGYFGFMWIDFCPQSFYGIYDYWGFPKNEGIGGGLRAYAESSAPIGIFMEYKDRPVALHVVNDLLTDQGECRAEWRVTSDSGEVVATGAENVRLGPDSHVRVSDLSFPVSKGTPCYVSLILYGPHGQELTRNFYRNPFSLQPRPKGYPERMDNELGMRLWWAGLSRE